MERKDLQAEMERILPNLKYKLQEPMAKHTSFRIGGPAEIMVFPQNAEELSSILKLTNILDMKPAILGAGTNVLAPDSGIPGIVICLKDGMNGIDLLENNRICVMSGVTMTRAAVFAANNGLSGMEFAHGIPGTIGGGIYMNAGAYGGEIAQICESATVIDRKGNLCEMGREDLQFSYRHSILQNSEYIVVSGIFQLVPDNTEKIWGRMKDLMARRSASQPLDLPSAGSAFKRPAKGYAAALIDECGLKGYRVGQAAISEKHAGFAVNLGNASAEDVKQLLQDVSAIVLEKTGIQLEPEVLVW